MILDVPNAPSRRPSFQLEISENSEEISVSNHSEKVKSEDDSPGIVKKVTINKFLAAEQKQMKKKQIDLERSPR